MSIVPITRMQTADASNNVVTLSAHNNLIKELRDVQFQVKEQQKLVRQLEGEITQLFDMYDRLPRKSYEQALTNPKLNRIKYVIDDKTGREAIHVKYIPDIFESKYAVWKLASLPIGTKLTVVDISMVGVASQDFLDHCYRVDMLLTDKVTTICTNGSCWLNIPVQSASTPTKIEFSTDETFIVKQ